MKENVWKKVKEKKGRGKSRKGERGGGRKRENRRMREGRIVSAETGEGRYYGCTMTGSEGQREGERGR